MAPIVPEIVGVDEAGDPALDERGDVAVAGAAQKIALSVAGHGAILDLGRADRKSVV